MVSAAQTIETLFDSPARIQRMLDFEAALARALARVSIISSATADTIVAQCNVAHLDVAAIVHDAESAGNDAIPMVEQLRERVVAVDPAAAKHVHWGATSQDAIDTALVLQLRDALAMIDEQLARLILDLADLADAHAATPIVGRTLLQQAAPTTFGFKAAGWLDALVRHRTRLTAARADVTVLQFGGAVGNLSALGNDGARVAAALAEELGLANPGISWHGARDRVVAVVVALASIVGTLGKVARDIALLAQSEIGEVREPSAEGRGRSSTMPQKKNPVGSASILAASMRMPSLAATMLSVMAQEHERGLGGWHAEWETVPVVVALTHRALVQAAFVIVGLEVDTDRMARNIDATNGLVFAEAVSFALMARVDRATAAEIVQRAIERSTAERAHLRDALRADAEVTRVLSSAEIDALFDPRLHLGVAEQAARRVAAAARTAVAGRRGNA